MGWFSEEKKKEEKNETGERDFMKLRGKILDGYTRGLAKKPIDLWKKYDKYMEDDQYDSEEEDWKPKPQINICWATLRSVHANMTAGKTSVNVTPRIPQYDQLAQDLRDVIMSYWDALEMDMVVSESEWIRPKLGSVCLKSVWNADRDDLDCEVVHPMNVIIDPAVTNPFKIQTASFVDFVKPVNMNYVANKYSKENDKYCRFTKEELKSMLSTESGAETEIYGDYQEENPGGSSAEGSYDPEAEIILHEFWYRDDSMKLQVAWYAGSVILKASEEYLGEGEAFYKHGLYPLVYIPYILRDKRLEGRSELQSIVGLEKRDGLQDIINKLLQDYLVSEKLTGQPQIAYQHGKVKNPQNWTSEPGQRIPVRGNPHQVIKEIQGKVMTENLEAVNQMLTHADRVTGLWDITQGRTTSSITTLGQTSLLLEQAQKPQTDKIQTLNFGLSRLVELWVEHLCEFVSTDKEYVRSSKKDGEREAFTFNPAALQKVRRTGADPEDTRRLQFKVSVDIGARVVMTPAYEIQLALELYGAELLDLEGVYGLLPEFKGKGKALERLSEMKKQQGRPTADEIVSSMTPEQQEAYMNMDEAGRAEMLKQLGL